MAKKPVKRSAKPAAKSPAKTVNKKTSASKPKTLAPTLEEVSVEALKRLQHLNMEHGLQADIEWCLGSFRYDQNPAGLYTMAERALNIFKLAAGKNPASVPSKLIRDLDKVLKSR